MTAKFSLCLLIATFALPAYVLASPVSQGISLSGASPQNTAPVAAQALQPVDVDAFVENLALTHLALAVAHPDMDAISGYLSVIKAYNAQKTIEQHIKTPKLILVVIDYTMSGHASLKQVIAPVTLIKGVSSKNCFPLLEAVMGKLSNMPTTLQDIRLVSATIPPDNSMVLPVNVVRLAAILDRKQVGIIEHSIVLAPIDDINTQLALMDFFTRQGFQDAAYLTLENVERMLASASQHKIIRDGDLAALIKRLDAQEATLKAELPYQF